MSYRAIETGVILAAEDASIRALESGSTIRPPAILQEDNVSYILQEDGLYRIILE